MISKHYYREGIIYIATVEFSKFVGVRRPICI
jgi:hypothetical protein